MQLQPIKLNITFPATPIIYVWIEAKFNECKDLFDCMAFVQECIEIAKETTNEVKKEAYEKTAHALFSELTGKSLEIYNLTLEKWQQKL